MMSKCFSGASDYVYLRSELGRKEKKKKTPYNFRNFSPGTPHAAATAYS